MSVNCNITVQFQVKDPRVLAECARRHLDVMDVLEESEESEDHEKYDGDAHRMLRHAAEGHGVGVGPRGDMFTWGSVGNHSSIETFVDALRPFWVDGYGAYAMFDFSGIVVMFQREQSPYVQIYEISNDRTAPGTGVHLVVRDMETPFPLFGEFYERPEGLVPPSVRTTVWDDE